MYIVTIRRNEERRSRKDRRKSNLSGEGSVRRTANPSRRRVSDRRSSADRRKAMTYELPEDQKHTIERIIGMLEKSVVQIEHKVQQTPSRRASGVRATEAMVLALNVLYSKKCGGGFNQLEVLSDPVRGMYVVKNRVTGLEAEIPSDSVDRDKGSNADRESHEKEIVKAFKKLGKACKD